MRPGKLYFGDNLLVLRDYIADESIDLVYLDPPFNSNQDYNVLFKEHDLTSSTAQLRAFEDCWHWDQQAQAAFEELTSAEAAAHGVPPAVSVLTEAFCRALPQRSDMAAYLVMMAPRLLELRRVMTETGSIYLHYDSTASHYLKLLLDAIFGPQQFRNEITWKRTNVHNDAKRWSPVSDSILFYSKGDRFTWNPIHIPHSAKYVASKYRHQDGDGRMYQLDNITSPKPRPNMMYEWKGHASPQFGWRYSRETMTELDREGRIWYPDSKTKRPRLKRYLDEMRGAVVGNVWTDIDPINSQAAERLGYQTQKPLALLERIIQASSNPADVVLDPFCGCGTAVEAAQRLGREWIGIDVTHLAIRVVRDRLAGKFPGIQYELLGEPQDVESARILAETPYQFQWWAVHKIGAHAVGAAPGSREGKRGGDRGIDGLIKFRVDNRVHEVVVSVKSGRVVTPAMVRELRGTMEREKAAMGVLFTMQEATQEMRTEAARAGTWKDPSTGRKYPRLQIVSASDIFAGKRVEHPGVEIPDRPPVAGETLTLPGLALPAPPPRRGMLVTVPKQAAEAPTPLITADREASTPEQITHRRPKGGTKH